MDSNLMTAALDKLLESMLIPDCLRAIIRLSDHPAAGETLPASQNHTIRDWDLLQELLPASFRDNIERSDIMMQFLMTFALRHQISWLNLHLHRMASGESDSELETLVKLLGRKNQRPQTIPILGLNAVGIVIRYQFLGQCRYLDPYTNTVCTASCRNAFCEDHQSEIWWSGEGETKMSAMAKMLAFYHQKTNINSHSKAELEDMTRRFWSKYQWWATETSQGDMSGAMASFGIAGVRELETLGHQGLKKRYLKLCLNFHPDQGGDGDQFITLKNHYDLLRVYLARDA